MRAVAREGSGAPGSAIGGRKCDCGLGKSCELRQMKVATNVVVVAVMVKIMSPV